MATSSNIVIEGQILERINDDKRLHKRGRGCSNLKFEEFGFNRKEDNDFKSLDEAVRYAKNYINNNGNILNRCNIQQRTVRGKLKYHILPKPGTHGYILENVNDASDNPVRFVPCF